MAQVHILNNFFPIANAEAWAAIIARMEQAVGKPFADPRSFMFDVCHAVDGYGIWSLQAAVNDGEAGFYATLDGVPKDNMPMPTLRSAEDLGEMMLALREYNVRNAEHRAGDAARLAEINSMYNNTYKIADKAVWMDAMAALMPFGDLARDGSIEVKTSSEKLTTGVYKLTLVTVDGEQVLEVEADGTPVINYPIPAARSAEDVVSVILKLHSIYSTAGEVNRYGASEVQVKPLVASVKDGQNEIRLFSNGTITITGPGVMKIVNMADSDTARANELMEQILDLTNKQ